MEFTGQLPPFFFLSILEPGREVSEFGARLHHIQILSLGITFGVFDSIRDPGNQRKDYGHREQRGDEKLALQVILLGVELCLSTVLLLGIQRNDLASYMPYLFSFS